MTTRCLISRAKMSRPPPATSACRGRWEFSRARAARSRVRYGDSSLRRSVVFGGRSGQTRPAANTNIAGTRDNKTRVYQTSAACTDWRRAVQPQNRLNGTTSCRRTILIDCESRFANTLDTRSIGFYGLRNYSSRGLILMYLLSTQIHSHYSSDARRRDGTRIFMFSHDHQIRETSRFTNTNKHLLFVPRVLSLSLGSQWLQAAATIVSYLLCIWPQYSSIPRHNRYLWPYKNSRRQNVMS